MRKLVFTAMAATRLVPQYQALNNTQLNLVQNMIHEPTQFTLLGPNQTPEMLNPNLTWYGHHPDNPHIVQTDDDRNRGFEYASQKPVQPLTDGNDPNNCADIKGMLTSSHVVGNCDEDVTVSLLSKIKLACPGAEIIITGGLDDTIAFDQPNGTLTFRANPRPADFIINYEVLFQHFLEQVSTFKASLRFLRQCQGKKQGRRLQDCACLDKDEMYVLASLPSPQSFSYTLGVQTKFVTGIQLVRGQVCALREGSLPAGAYLVTSIKTIKKDTKSMATMPTWLTFQGQKAGFHDRDLWMVADTISCDTIGYYEVEINDVFTNTCTLGKEPKYTHSWKALLTVSPGTSTAVANELLDNYTNYIGETTTITYPWVVYQPSGCIVEPTSRTISVTGSEPSCVNRTDVTKIEATGCTIQHIGTLTYQYSMTYGVAQTYSKQFTLTIACKVTSLTPTQTTIYCDYQIGQSATQCSIPSYTKLPNCGDTPIFSLHETTPADFVNISGQTISVQTADFSKVRSHTLKIKATAQEFPYVVNSDVVLIVKIACQVTSLTASSMTIADMNHKLNVSTPLTYSDTPIVLPTITSMPAGCGTISTQLINQSTNQQLSWIVNNIITATDHTIANVYNMKAVIAVNTSQFVSSLDKIEINFKITLKTCQLISILPDATASFDIVYTIGDSQVLKTVPDYTINPANCGYTKSVTLKRMDADPAIPLFISDQISSQKIGVYSTRSEDVGTYNFKIVAQVTDNSFISDQSFTFTSTIACKVTELKALTPMAPITEVLQQAEKRYSVPDFQISPSNCGATYQLELFQLVGGLYKAAPSYIKLDLTVTPNKMVIDFQEPNAVSGTFQFAFKAKSVITPTQVGEVVSYSEFSVELINKQCETMKLLTPQLDPISYVISTLGRNIPFPQYEMLPINCIYDIQYELKVIQKLPDPIFGKTKPFYNPALVVPSFIKLDPVVGIQIEGKNFTESWNKYTLELKAYDKYKGGSNSNFLIVVTTSTDCITDIDLNFPVPLKNSTSYEIGKPVTKFKLQEIIDFKSLATEVPNICGPVEYKLYLTDNQMTQKNDLPLFVKYDNITHQIDIYSLDSERAGTWYLLIEAFYQLFSLDPNVFRRKELITVTLTNPIQNFPYAINQTIAVQPVQNQTIAVQPVQNKTEEPIQYQQNFTQINQTQLPPTRFVNPAIPANMQNTINQRVELRYAQVYLKDIDESGKLTLQVMEEVQLINEGQKIDDDMLSIEFIKNSNEDIKMMGWDLISYTKTQIQIQINFNQLLLVSAGVKPDEVVIELNRRLFLPVNDPYKMVANESPPIIMDIQYTKDLPQMMPSKSKLLLILLTKTQQRNSKFSRTSSNQWASQPLQL